MKTSWSAVMAAILLSGCAHRSDHAVAIVDAPDREYAEDYSDAEPPDPAEQRPQVMPPPRPQERGTGPTWIERGPAPTRSAQVNVPPDNEVSGAIHAIAAHPSDANILYIGAVNGGIWRTNDALAARPSWAPLTDRLPSQSIGSLAFDPLDASRQTLIAGTGRLSNFARRGDDEIGVYRTTDGGLNWAQLGGSTLLGQRLIAVAARGSVLMAASGDTAGTGLYRSVDTGANWVQVSGTNGLPTGSAGDLVGDPASTTRFYYAARGSNAGVFLSNDTGASWSNVSGNLTGLTTANNLRLAVGPGGVVFLAVVTNGQLSGVWRSADQGASWTAMDVPAVHPGSQGFPNTSIAADPNNNNIVYIAGDRITVGPFTANVQRGDASLPPGSQFTTIMDANGGNTTPHADTRAMWFDAAGNLLQSDDGGIYRRINPTSSSGTWSSVNGNLNVMEVHDLDHDNVSNILVIGTQDNGTHRQQTSAGTVWTWFNGGDGGDVVVDDTTLISPATGLRFISSQNLGGFRRVAVDANNVQTGSQGIVTSGIVTDPQFVTPTELSTVDQSRLLVGGLNTIYESTNANVIGSSPTLVSIGGPGANRNAMAYGAVGNPGLAYVGRSAAVWRRSGAGNPFVATSALPAGAAAITDVAMDFENPAIVWAVDDNQVFRSIDSGQTWQDITGNLPAISSQDFRTIEFIPGAPDRVALGTRSGVYVANADSSVWSLLGAGLPDVLVFDLRYVPTNQTLYAGTLGRGVWSVSLQTDAIFANGYE